jgi:hypothetical protein
MIVRPARAGAARKGGVTDQERLKMRVWWRKVGCDKIDNGVKERVGSCLLRKIELQLLPNRERISCPDSGTGRRSGYVQRDRNQLD